MAKRTRAVSVLSTAPSDSSSSTASGQDHEYAQETEGVRPATRRRTNHANCTSSSQLGAASLETLSSASSSSPAADPKAARKLQRKERNRISAQHSRDRRKHESQELRGRLEESETRLSALQADNDRLVEENSRFKLELEKSSSLQAELCSLKERFEMLERILLSGSQPSLIPSTTPTPGAAPSSVSALCQTPISAPIQADSRVGSEAHATGMHSLFRSTRSLNSCSGITEATRVTNSRQGHSISDTQGRTTNSHPLSTIAPSTTSYSQTRSRLPMNTTPKESSPPALTKAYMQRSKTSLQARAAASLPTTRLSLRDKQRFLLRRQQQRQASQETYLRAHLLARAKLITMTMIDSLSNSRRN